jgi:hypothetical protein
MSEKSPSSFKGALALGARLGLKWTTIITGPLWLIALLIGASFWLFRFWFGEGLEILNDPQMRWQMLSTLGGPFGGFFVTCMWGVIAGVVVTTSTYLISRGRRPSSKVD